MKLGPKVELPLKNIFPAPWRQNQPYDEAKVARAMEFFEREGIIGVLKARWLDEANQTVEQAAWHHRCEALRRMNYQKTLTVQILVGTEEEFFEVYLQDNSEIDRQSFAWALNAVGYALAGNFENPGYDVKLSLQMGLLPTQISLLRRLAWAVQQKQVTSQLHALHVNVPIGLQLGSKLLLHLKTMSLEQQAQVVTALMGSKQQDLYRELRRIFDRLQVQPALPRQTPKPATRKTWPSVLRKFEQATKELGESLAGTDVSTEDLVQIVAWVEYLKQKIQLKD
jgi:hypothetical protein